jgi:uncharacterized protein YecE (DUF72 family)
VVGWARGGESKDGDFASNQRAPLRKKRDVYVYFDNDAKVRAPRDARQLDRRVAELMGLEAPAKLRGRDQRKSPPACVL